MGISLDCEVCYGWGTAPGIDLKEQAALMQEATELMKIFGAILKKTEDRSGAE